MNGGMIDEQWSIFRRTISKACCLIAAPLVKVKDPMSGFFALRKLDFDKIKDSLKPISYKVALEVAVKGSFRRFGEVPFRFAARYKGKSKVTLRVIFGMLWHLLLLYKFKIFKRKQ